MIKKLYIAISGLPLIAFIGFWLYSDSLEGWGQWAAAIALKWIMIFSLVLGVIGIGLTIKAMRKKENVLGLAIATILASSVGIWFLAKILLHELQRSF